MISHGEALARLRASVKKSAPVESVPLERARDRILAAAVTSPRRIPPFANAAMDGFAVRSTDAVDRFRVVGSLAAGDTPPTEAALCPSGSAWEIMTGAPVPEGFDAVFRVEDSTREGEWVRSSAEIRPGMHVRPAGEDFSEGDSVAAEGTRLSVEHILALATVGIPVVPVRSRPRVAIIATGRELVPSSAKDLPPGKIFNSTHTYLPAALEMLGTDPRFLGSIDDDPLAFLALMGQARSDGYDIVVTTGAVSMGKHDFIAAALSDLKATTLFHKVFIRPGKPILAAAIEGGPLVFGLPGNPVSTVVGLRFFVAPYLRYWLGRPMERPVFLKLTKSVKKPAALKSFLKARARWEKAEVEVLPGQGSALVRPLLGTNAWVVLPEGRETFEAGEIVEVFSLHDTLDDESPRRVSVRLFGALRECARGESLEVEIVPGMRARDLKAAIAILLRGTTGAALVDRSAVANASEILGDDSPVDGARELVLLPPVCGG